MSLKKILGDDPITSIYGLVALVFVGIYLLMGRCSLDNFMLAMASIAAALGLFRAKDSRSPEKADREKEECP